MAGLSSLGVIVSGLNAAQAGLYVTGHNMANNSTVGYVRQQALQHDFKSHTVGSNGGGIMQVGLGTDITEIRQIRDKFLDMSYRKSVSKHGYYAVKYEVGLEIENIIGELEGAYKVQAVVEDLWEALQELELNPTGLETRGNFLTACKAFVNKFDESYNDLYKYQQNLNDQVAAQVQQVNQLVTSIHELNKKISIMEASGDNANDYRDLRNLDLDKLSQILDITYSERANGHVEIMCGGKDLLVGGTINKLGLRYTSEGWDFVEPVFTSSTSILEYGDASKNARSLFDLNNTVTNIKGNDNGSLLSLLIARGPSPANYTSENSQFLIPQTMKMLDTLFHEIVTTMNDLFSPVKQEEVDGVLTGNWILDWDNVPYDLSGTQQFFELFSRDAERFVDRFVIRTDENGNTVYDDEGRAIYDLIEEDPSNMYTLYSIGNVVMHKNYKDSTGNSLLAVSKTNQIHDKGIVEDILAKWTSGFIKMSDNEQGMSVRDFYRKIITDISIDIGQAGSILDAQAVVVEQYDYERQAVMAVSLDEEMKNMMMYQHAYNAASRVLNVIDGMIDKIVNGTGRAGR